MTEKRRCFWRLYGVQNETVDQAVWRANVRMGLAFLLATLTPALVVHAQEDSPARQFCRMTTESSTAAFDVCLGKQIQAVESIIRYVEWAEADGGTEGARVLSVMAFCRDRWMPDHRLVDNCLRARALIPPP